MATDIRAPDIYCETKPLHVSNFQLYTCCYTRHYLRQNCLCHVPSTWEGVPRLKCLQKVGEAFIFHDGEWLSIDRDYFADQPVNTLGSRIIDISHTNKLAAFKSVSCLALTDVEVVGSSVS